MDEANFSLEDLIAGGKDNFRVIEEQIDIDTQAVYFRYSQKVRENAKVNTALTDYDLLLDETVPVRKKKKILVSLASCKEVKAYRMLESFLPMAEPLLKDWAILAFNESRMVLENSFYDEQQVYISTGMGGKGCKLRYFIVIFSRNDDGFSEFERRFVKDEIEFTFKLNKCDIEILDATEANHIALTALVPIKKSIQNLMAQTFKNCNQLDEFIHQKFIVSNIKAMTKKEIFDFYKNK